MERFSEAEKRILKVEDNSTNTIKMLKLAWIIKNTVNNTDDNFLKAINIRNHIYQNVPLKRTPDGFNYLDFDNSYTCSIRDESVGHYCGGLVALYATALETQGIPARYVGYFTDNKQPYDSHATIEFWYKDKWYASDPTFNVMYLYKGEYLSYSELYILVINNIPYDVVSNGFPVYPERAIGNYPVKPIDFMSYMVIHPSVIWVGNKKLYYPMELFPSTWDGSITYDDIGKRDVRNFEGIYRYLYHWN